MGGRRTTIGGGPSSGAEGASGEGGPLRRVEARYAGRTMVVDIAEGASVGELRQSCALALAEPAACLTMLCAGHKLSVESAAMSDVIPLGSRLMLLNRGPPPPPRLTIVDTRRGTSAYAMEVPIGLSVAELIELARQAVGFPISMIEATLFSSHLKVFLKPELPVSSYDLPTLSEACLLAAPPPCNAVVPRVSSLLRGQSTGRLGRVSPLTGPPSPPVTRAPVEATEPSANPQPATAPQPATVFTAACPHPAAASRCADGGAAPRSPSPKNRTIVEPAALPTRSLAAGVRSAPASVEPRRRRYVCSSGGSVEVGVQSQSEGGLCARPPACGRSRSNGCGVRSGGTVSPPCTRTQSSGRGGGLARSRSHHTLLRAGCQRFQYPIPHPPPRRRNSADDGRHSRNLGLTALAEIAAADPHLPAPGCVVAETSPLTPTQPACSTLPPDDDEAPLSLDDLLAAAVLAR